MKTLNTYMDDAWEDLESDEGWWRSVLALGLMNCVPVIGQIAMYGYLFDWAKEAAWGMKTKMSRNLNDIGRCFKYGVLALWVIIIWIAPIVAAGLLIGFIPAVGPILCFLIEVFAIFVGALSVVGAFRSIVYEHVMPGLQFKRVFRMYRHDPSSLWQVFGIFLLNVPLLAAALFIVLLPTIPFIITITSATSAELLGSDLVPIVLLAMITIVVVLMVWVIGAIGSAFIATLYIRALGHWMEAFKPAKWKAPDSPMPFEVAAAAEKEKRQKAKADEKRRKREEKKKGKTARKEKGSAEAADESAEESSDE